ncbi:MAG: DUF2147 domain-containing protein [Flavobacteriales bacterium]|nr:DUF2147 domain-containing protein [Flavobacteriales bacterium]
MRCLFFLLMIVFFSFSTNAQQLVGKWKTIDDETGKTKSIIQIYEQNGKYYGKIVELLLPEDKGKLCDKCSGTNKNKPIEGMVIMEGMNKDGDGFSGGKIMDPKSGKTYKCSIEFDGKDALKVRGFIGISLIGRTQTWKRA